MQPETKKGFNQFKFGTFLQYILHSVPRFLIWCYVVTILMLGVHFSSIKQHVNKI
jgi:hypothetical protein